MFCSCILDTPRAAAPTRMNASVELCICLQLEGLRKYAPYARWSTCWWICRPDWPGSLDVLAATSAARLQSVVGADVSYAHFETVSGAADIEAAIAQLNARLAARGAITVTVRAHPGRYY